MLKSYNGFSGAQRERGARILKKAIENGIIPAPSKCKCILCGQDKGIRHYNIFRQKAHGFNRGMNATCM